MDMRSRGSPFHQVDEPAAEVPEQVRRRHADVVEEQLGGVLRMQAELVELAAASEPGGAALPRR